MSVFEQIKQIDENGNEYWTARKLAKVLEYSEYRHFVPVINRAKEACENSGQNLSHHFEDMLEMVNIGKRNTFLKILLCVDKGNTQVKYATAGLDPNIFVQKYMVELPDEETLKEYITREFYDIGK
ncbi:MAG: hypothetical protein LBN27_10900 [Prevotellaceae bacterium]|nr:hypothetical protein [Prevotellaceae bacterium]